MSHNYNYNKKTFPLNKTKDNRPTFYFRNDTSKPLRAGGILFYKKINNEPYFLMIDNAYSGYLEDIGGKTDEKDNNINSTIIREVDEETNSLINKEYVTMELLKNYTKLYCKYSKYILYVVEADDYVSSLSTENFSDVEIHTGFNRKIYWYSREQVKNSKLNPRLDFEELKSFIEFL